MRRSPLARPVLARTLTAVVAAALVSGALAGCSGVALDNDCAPAFTSGDASSIVTVSGDVGDSPAVTFPTPLVADDMQRSVTHVGTGEPAEAGSTVLYSFVYFIGKTGEALTQSADAVGTASDTKLAFGEALECATAGSRIVLTGPAEQIDAQYAGTTETLVAVIDVESVLLGKANGVNQIPQDGMPTVVTAVDGEPGIAVGYAVVPDEERTAVIKAGGGATAEDGDLVALHVRTWSWPAGVGSIPTLSTGDTWATGTPTVVDLTEDVITNKTLFAAIEGTKVGSQLLIVFPPDTDGGDATVFVIDVLGILPQN